MLELTMVMLSSIFVFVFVLGFAEFVFAPFAHSLAFVRLFCIFIALPYIPLIHLFLSPLVALLCVLAFVMGLGSTVDPVLRCSISVFRCAELGLRDAHRPQEITIPLHSSAIG